MYVVRGVIQSWPLPCARLSRNLRRARNERREACHPATHRSHSHTQTTSSDITTVPLAMVGCAGSI